MPDDVLDFSIKELQELVSKRKSNAATQPRYIFDGVPQWFISAMKKLSSENPLWKAELPGGDGEAAVLVFDELDFHDYKWFDHAGWVGDDLVSEPYQIRAEGIAMLKSFCEQTDTEFAISGASFHYPTMTLRITIRHSGDSTKVIPTKGQDHEPQEEAL